MEPRLARLLIAAALASGIAGDLLFDGIGPGVNVLIAVAAGLVATWWFRPRGLRVDRLDWWIPPVTLLAALGVAVRADVIVVLADGALAAAGMVAWALAVAGGGLTRRSAGVVAALGVEAGVHVAVGAALAAGRAVADRPAAGAARAGRRALPVVRGLVVAAPVLFVFAALLGSADAAFAGLVGRLLDLGLDVDELVRRTTLSLAVAWVVAGGLGIAAGGLPGVLAPTATADATTVGGAGAPAHGPGATEALTVLVAVEVLFAAFVAIQVAYLFGGFETLTRSGMTYSDYARQGFFQLVAVVAGAGLLLLVGNALAGHSRWFVPAALGLVGLTALILVSAAVRLGLYQQAYGWTELRFYVVAAIAWLAIDLAVAAALIALRRAAWLVHAVALAGVAVVLGATVLGPSGFIAGQNVERALDPSLVPAGGRAGLDAGYAISLGDGAVPVLVEALPRLSRADRDQILDGLLRRRDQLESDPALAAPLAWNLERERARAALRRLEGFSPR